VATQNIAVDPGLDLLTLAGQAAGVASGSITFTTLPIEHFGRDPLGEDVNIVDQPRRGRSEALRAPGWCPRRSSTLRPSTVDRH